MIKNQTINQVKLFVFLTTVLLLFPLFQNRTMGDTRVINGNEISVEGDAHTNDNSALKVSSPSTRSGTILKVPFWQIGDTWTYYSTLTCTSTNLPDDYLTVWMNITYTVSKIEHYNKNGTSYLAYNLTTTGDAIGRGIASGRDIYLDGKSGGIYDFSQKAPLTGYRIIRTSDLAPLYDEFFCEGHLHTQEWIIWLSVPGSLESKLFDMVPTELVDFPGKDGDLFWYNTTQRRVFNIEVDYEDMSECYDYLGQNNYTVSGITNVQNTVIAGTFDTYFLDGTPHRGDEQHDCWYSPVVKNFVRENNLNIKLSETGMICEKRELRSYAVSAPRMSVELHPPVNFPGLAVEVRGEFPDDPNELISVEIPFTGESWSSQTDINGAFTIDVTAPEVASDGTNTTMDNGSFGVCAFLETSPSNKVVTSTLTLVTSDNLAPVACAGESLSIPEDIPYMFNGSLSSDNYAVVNYTWTVEGGGLDGNVVTLYDVTPTHTFDLPGNYSVCLEVTDIGDNCAMDIINITVLDTTPPAPIQGFLEGEVIPVHSPAFLDGSASYDFENGIIVNYTWDIIGAGSYDGPFYGVNVSHIFTEPGVFYVELTIYDDSFNSASSSVNVTVVDITSPTTNAGDDVVINQHETFVFNGSLSSDDVGIMEYNWTFIYANNNQTLFGPSPFFTFDDAGIYEVTLRVVDGAGNIGQDEMKVTVVDITLPVAVVGQDRVVDQNMMVIFDGTGSNDNVGVINYTWTFVDVVARELFGASPSYVFHNAGLFEVLLNVTDEAGNFHTTSFRVTVNDTSLPVADAGPDQIVVPGTIVTFNGSLSFDNVGVVEWKWRLMYLGKPYILTGSQTTMEFIIPGIYNVTLDVVDASGNIAEDILVVTVRDTLQPVAHAGDDVVINAGEWLSLDARGSTDNVAIETYFWYFMYNNTPQVISGSVSSFIFDIPGNYTIKLNVSDLAGNWAVDEMWVNVVSVENDAEELATTDAPGSDGFQWWFILVIVVILLLIGVGILFIVRGKSDMVSSEHIVSGDSLEGGCEEILDEEVFEGDEHGDEMWE